MNINMSLSSNELFFQAINHPSAVDEDIILALIEKYPYVQGLRFVYERKIFEESSSLQNMSSTLLYASSPNWLYEFMHTQVAEEDFSATLATTSSAGADSITATAEVAFEEEAESDMSGDLNLDAAVGEEVDCDKAEPKKKTDELDLLIQAGVAQDYFRSREPQSTHAVSAEESNSLEMTAPEMDDQSSTDHQERVTVYDDDTMPYSFLWWLHKTRLEYAETYQPYVRSPLGPMQPSRDDVAKIHEKLDTQLLDQQIRENIFHLQSPEAKLSDEVKTTISFQIPRKTDEVIEKFIREEPIIQPLQAEKLDLENKARRSSEDQYSLVTETLAKIYLEQGLYPKAIEVYKKLVLKYPEKNAYFAARITELEKKLN